MVYSLDEPFPICYNDFTKQCERMMKMFRVVKRDGEVADFNLFKVNEAMTKAFDATKNEYNSDIIDLLALRVTADFQSKINQGRPV